MVELNDILEACARLDEKLQCSEEKNDREEIIQKHITLCHNKLKFRSPEFKTGLEWMNVDSPLSLHDNLKGKIVVLDFFTYCCVNCLHVLPDLEALENKFSVKDGVVVVGVHSAKFDNEKISANILSAIMRYNITHPVVNDDSAVLWQELQIQCWPTFVVLSPLGSILQFYVGEGHRKTVLEFVEQCIKFYKEKNLISDHLLSLSLEKDKMEGTQLRFPGKICLNETGTQIIVSDTGHNRILVMGCDGIVKHCIGGVERGYRDGGYKKCQFDSPQGVAVLDDNIYVADTENHVIRKIDLKKEAVSTITGNGHQGNDKEGGNKGMDQEISSPWDVVLGPSPDGKMNSVLYISMAGTHQIWVYFLSDCKWYKGREYTAGTCVSFAGNGSEENRNNSYPNKAAFAQPSGLAINTHPEINSVFVADSESSTIRMISLKDGSVKALVGGERDPMNLFAYGDKDGVGIEAKLQHPLGVAVSSDPNSLLVADSYNHKIKSVDIKKKMCSTLAGSGSDYMFPVDINEPGGLCVDGSSEVVYIADTNNHTIKILNLNTKTVSQLPVIFQEDTTDSISIQLSDILKPGKTVITNDKKVTYPGRMLDIRLNVCLPLGNHITDEAPSTWVAVIENLTTESSGSPLFSHKGSVCKDTQQTLFSYVFPQSDISAICIYVKCKVFYCDDTNVCRMKEHVFSQNISVESKTYSNAEDITSSNCESISFTFTV